MLLNIIKYGLSEGIAKLAPFLTTLYVAKYLSPDLFGKYSLIVVMFEIVFIFISFNIQATTRIDYFKEEYEKFVRLKKNHFILSLFFALFGLTFVLFLGEEEQTILIILIVSALMRTFSVFIQAIFQCSKRVDAYILTNVSFVIVLSVTTYLLVNLGTSFYSWLYAILLASAVQLILAVKLYSFKGALSFFPDTINCSALKETFIPAALFMPQAIGWWMKTGADRAIIFDALGDVALGQYALAFQLSSIIVLSVVIINLALVPEVNSLIQAKKLRKVRSILLLVSLFLFIISVLVPLISHGVISFWYSSEYVDSIPLLYLLALSLLPQGIMMVYINVLYYSNMGAFVAKLIFSSFLFQAIVNYFIVGSQGIEGIIVCSFVVNVIVMVWIITCIYKNKLV